MNMRILDKYIRNTILGSWVLVMFILVGLDTIFSFIDQLGEMKQGYQIKEAFIFVLASVPETFYDMIAVASLLACLVGMGRLANDSEIIIIRSAGVSNLRVLWAVIKPALMIIFLGLLVGQWVSPKTSHFAESYRSIKRTGNNLTSYKHGYWQKEGNSYVYISGVEANGILHGVTIFDFDENQRFQAARSFDRSIFQGNYWSSLNVKETKLVEGRTEISNVQTQEWESEMTPEMLKLLVLSPEKLSITELYFYGSFLEKQGQNPEAYYLAFWKKVLLPVSGIAMVLIACSFVFGPLRGSPMGSRILIGVVIGLVFYQSQTLFSHMALVYQIQPLFASAIPSFLALFIGLFMVKRAF